MRITDLLKWGFPLFFASTTVIADGGAGDAADGGAGGGDEGAGEDAAEVTDDGAAEDATDTDADPDDVDDDEAGLSDDPDSGEGLDTAGARKKTEAAIQKTLNKLRETDPEGAKLLRKQFYTQERELKGYRSEFKTPAEARAARETFETYGGEEGITKLSRDANDYAAELTAMSKGDPSVIEDLAHDFPESLAKLTPAAAEKLAEINPQAYERFAGRIIARTLSEKGVAPAIDRILELIYDGKQKEAYEKGQALKQWIDGVKQFASAQPKDDSSGRNTAVDQREQTLAQREQQIFKQGIAKDVTSSMNASIEKNLRPYINNSVKAKRTLSPEQKKGLASGIYSRISTTLERDSKYQERLKALLAEGDAGRVTRYVSSEVDKLVQKAVRAEWHSRGFAGGAPAKKAAAASTTVAGISSKPSPDQIDWSKDRQRLRYTGNGEFGEATLKNGKVVKFRH